ncbi:MAG TPA: PDZ domain-containing protein [Pirellulales bacterium]|jgi:serine protease Do|nr:PDZ domain-containing protein [Pirellulales bacterium]
MLMTAWGGIASAQSLKVREEQAIKAAVARVAPSVVRIETVGGLERVGQVLIGTGPTTGLVVSADGYIISSAFNFMQKPASILVTLDDSSRHAAKLVATDHSRMLVLLKIETDKKLPMPEAAARDEMRVGAWALAVGRTFEASQPNVSLGIISALDRIWGKAIQTDAKVSPNNYGGPLVDIAGRVLGVLVPMSPEASGEMAGVEWYDSGIGFAVMWEDILRALPKLREGMDLHPGLLGINIKGSDIYAPPAMVAAVRATSPAYKAGFHAGDQIVEAAGHAVSRPAELKQQLGPLYAGQKIRIVAIRGQERIDREVELVDKIEPYVFPFLGILPMRPLADEKTDGVTIRYVYPESPAAAAGIQPGDRITSFAGRTVANTATIVEQLLPSAPGEKVRLEVRRGDQTLPLEIPLAALGENIPGELPPSHVGAIPAEENPPQRGMVSLKTPEFPNECLAYVPQNYNSKAACGVIIWLHAPGGNKAEEVVERWKALCEQYNFILLAPSSAERDEWRPTEARFVRRVLDELMKKYTVDPARIVVHGHEGGGALAYLVGLSNYEVIRGIAAVDAPLPRLVQPPDTDPVHRLAIYTTLATKSQVSAAVEAGIKRLRALKYPVTVKQVGEQGRYLTPEELEELVRWCDTLDRL